ncbi:DUF4333 domain-containing protein [Rhodococcus sp. NPDC060084]|uniref:DUF4333 domain-containing protein n=1 Tax=Rhodococcus sp. NPDC060084 TaxID=3347053 RepID=UPI003648B8B6
MTGPNEPQDPGGQRPSRPADPWANPASGSQWEATPDDRAWAPPHSGWGQPAQPNPGPPPWQQQGGGAQQPGAAGGQWAPGGGAPQQQPWGPPPQQPSAPQPGPQGWGQPAAGPGWGGPQQPGPAAEPGWGPPPGAQQWGQPGPHPGQQQPGQPWGPPSAGAQPWGQPPAPPKKSKLPLIIGAVVALVFVVGGVIAIATLGATTTLDAEAAEAGVAKVLTESYGATEVGDVSCPTGQEVAAGNSFACTVTVDGQYRSVTLTFTDDAGTYEVSRPN